MTNELLKTKLHIPLLRKEIVPRSHLLEQLDKNLWQGNGFNRKLTLVSAPAGYGKTTLTINWLQDGENDIAWLSLDENDNDPIRFFLYLIA